MQRYITNMKIGARIKELRKSKHMTQQQLADMLHIARATVISWEQDKFIPDSQNQLSLTKLFGLSEGYFAEMLYADKPKSTKDAHDIAEETAVMLAAEDTENQAEKVHEIIMTLYSASKAIEKALSGIDAIETITEVDHDLIDHQLAYMELQIGVAREYLSASANLKSPAS